MSSKGFSKKKFVTQIQPKKKLFTKVSKLQEKLEKITNKLQQTYLVCYAHLTFRNLLTRLHKNVKYTCYMVLSNIFLVTDFVCPPALILKITKKSSYRNYINTT